MNLSGETARAAYLALFDDNTRAAHHAALIDARCNEQGRWPTPAIVRKIAALFRVDVAELGAFFGLIRETLGQREVWTDIVRAPHLAETVEPRNLSPGQLRALGMMRSLVGA